ncbi:MAG: folate-binding protein YgfZ [Proteobacteria bacterium]|nr:folate-binding protein YgfZ [Pseudomonadota bacterium]
MNSSPEIPIYYDLSELGITSISGDDAQPFLQGQLSNDVTLLNQDSPHQLSAYCNPKGRILALFHVLILNTGYVLLAPRAIMEKVLPRLKMFVMRSAVKIAPLEGKTLSGLYAPGDIKTQTLATVDAKTIHLVKHGNDGDRFFLLSDNASEQKLNSGNDWNRLDIEQNLPQIYIENYEALIPQSVNLDIVKGVNFKKGCFPGQEIIARVKYRGKPKTRMIGVTVSRTRIASVGDPVFIQGRDSAAGQVINVANKGEHTLLSVSVPVTHITEGTVFLGEDRKISLERINSPYEITA